MSSSPNHCCIICLYHTFLHRPLLSMHHTISHLHQIMFIWWYGCSMHPAPRTLINCGTWKTGWIEEVHRSSSIHHYDLVLSEEFWGNFPLHRLGTPHDTVSVWRIPSCLVESLWASASFTHPLVTLSSLWLTSRYYLVWNMIFFNSSAKVSSGSIVKVCHSRSFTDMLIYPSVYGRNAMLWHHDALELHPSKMNRPIQQDGTPCNQIILPRYNKMNAWLWSSLWHSWVGDEVVGCAQINEHHHIYTMDLALQI